MVVALPLDKKASYLAQLSDDQRRHRGARARELSPGTAAADDGRLPGPAGHPARQRVDHRRNGQETRRRRPARAAAELAAKYPSDDVSLYLGTLISQDPETWGALAEAKES